MERRKYSGPVPSLGPYTDAWVYILIHTCSYHLNQSEKSYLQIQSNLLHYLCCALERGHLGRHLESRKN